MLIRAISPFATYIFSKVVLCIGVRLIDSFGVLRRFQHFQLFHSILWVSYLYFWSIYPDVVMTLSAKEGSHDLHFLARLFEEYGKL